MGFELQIAGSEEPDVATVPQICPGYEHFLNVFLSLYDSNLEIILLKFVIYLIIILGIWLTLYFMPLYL